MTGARAREPRRHTRRDVLSAAGLATAGATVIGAAGASTSRFGEVDAGDIFDGYTDRTIYRPGDAVSIWVSTRRRVVASQLRLTDVLGRTVDMIPTGTLDRQVPRADRPYELGFGYPEAIQYRLPAGLASGVYTIHDKIVLVVGPRAGSSRPLVVLPMSTINAYSTSGGKSLYHAANSIRYETRAQIVSFRRPQTAWEPSDARQFLLWAARTGVDLDVTTDMDLSAQDLAGRSLVVVAGHSEYWTRAARDLFDGFVDGGGNALVLSGNTMWWQTRVENAALVCHREASLDPLGSTPQATVKWEESPVNRSPLLSIGGSFSYGGYSHQGLSRRAFQVVAPDHPVMRGVQVGRNREVRLLQSPGHGLPATRIEYDGAPVVLDRAGRPTAVAPGLAGGYDHFDLVAFDHGFRGRRTHLTLVDLRRTPSAGRIINFGNNVMGRSLTTSPDRAQLSTMVLNAFALLGAATPSPTDPTPATSIPSEPSPTAPASTTPASTTPTTTTSAPRGSRVNGL